MEELKMIKRFDDYKLGVMKNDAIEAVYNMSLNQLKIFIAFITLIDKNDIEFKEYKIEAKSLMSILNITNKDDIYMVTDKIAESLIEKHLLIKDAERKSHLRYTIFSKIEYRDGALTVRFNEEMKPFLLNLKENFTKFKLSEIKPFGSKYSIRIYQLLKQYQNIGERTIEIKDLREMLGLEKELKSFGNFRQKVLEIAQKELENTPMAFDFVPIKRGRGGKVVEVRFVLKKKQAIEETPQESAPQQLENQIPKIEPESAKKENPNKASQKQIMELIVEVPQEYRTHALEKMFSEYLQQYDVDYIKKQIEYTNAQKPRNYFAYLKTSIEEDFAGAEMAESEKARQKRIFEEALKEIEREKEHDIEVAVDLEKYAIYSEYINLFDPNEKQEFLKKYYEKAKELYPNAGESELEFKIECLITEDIIAKNETYQMRLNKVHKQAEKKAQADFEERKQNLFLKLKNNLF